MTAALRFDRYRWAGGEEAVLRFGPADGPAVIVAPPLFEEANRTRALIVAVLRGLAAKGIGGALPDMPGQGESIADLCGVRLNDWRSAFAAAAGPRALVVAMRGGALVDGDVQAAARLHIAPLAGAALVRDLMRAGRVTAIAAGGAPPADAITEDGAPLRLAGNLIDRALLRDLAAAVPGPADRTLARLPDDGPRRQTPWHAAEPVADPRLAAALTDAIAGWVRSCAA